MSFLPFSLLSFDVYTTGSYRAYIFRNPTTQQLPLVDKLIGDKFCVGYRSLLASAEFVVNGYQGMDSSYELADLLQSISWGQLPF